MLRNLDAQVTNLADGIVVPMQKRGYSKYAILRNIFVIAGSFLFVGLFIPSGFSDVLVAMEICLVGICLWMAIRFDSRVSATRSLDGLVKARDESDFLRSNLMMPRLGTLVTAGLMCVPALATLPLLPAGEAAAFFHAILLVAFFCAVSASFYVMGSPIPSRQEQSGPRLR